MTLQDYLELYPSDKYFKSIVDECREYGFSLNLKKYPIRTRNDSINVRKLDVNFITNILGMYRESIDPKIIQFKKSKR